MQAMITALGLIVSDGGDNAGKGTNLLRPNTENYISLDCVITK